MFGQLIIIFEHLHPTKSAPYAKHSPLPFHSSQRSGIVSRGDMVGQKQSIDIRAVCLHLGSYGNRSTRFRDFVVGICESREYCTSLPMAVHIIICLLMFSAGLLVI